MPLIDIQKALERILTDERAYRRFLADRVAYGERLGLSALDIAALVNIDGAGLAIYRRRLHEQE